MDVCGRIIVRDYGWKIPCAHIKPCPLHDRQAFSARPQAEGGGSPHGGGTTPLSAPLPRLFDEWEAA